MESNIILSIHPEYVQKIESGEKTLEIRKRSLNIPKNTRLWIYTTTPISKISHTAIIEDILHLDPTVAWQKFSYTMGIKHQDYLKYTTGSKEVSLLKLKQVQALNEEFSQRTLASKGIAFKPPQFYKVLKKDALLLRILEQKIHNK